MLETNKRMAALPPCRIGGLVRVRWKGIADGRFTIKSIYTTLEEDNWEEENTKWDLARHWKGLNVISFSTGW